MAREQEGLFDSSSFFHTPLFAEEPLKVLSEIKAFTKSSASGEFTGEVETARSFLEIGLSVH